MTRIVLAPLLMAFLTLACAERDHTLVITLAGGSIGGAWAAIGEAIGECIRRQVPGTAFSYEPGQDGANAALVGRRKVELGLVHNALARLARLGAEPFREKYPELRSIALFYTDSAFQFVIAKRTGIASLGEIKLKRYPLRIAVNTRGSLMELASRFALEAHGISYDDIEAWGGKVYYLPFGPAFELMKDGKLDAVSSTAQYPETHVVEASLTLDLELLPLSREAIEKCNSRLGTKSTVIPAGTYRFQRQDLDTLSGSLILIAHADFPEEQAYMVAQALYNNLDYLKRVHRALRNLTVKDLASAGDEIPLHRGAARFYSELQ